MPAALARPCFLGNEEAGDGDGEEEEEELDESSSCSYLECQVVSEPTPLLLQYFCDSRLHSRGFQWLFPS